MFQQYYRDPQDLNNDFSNEQVFLQVNCAGRETHVAPMDADSVRRDTYLYYLTEGTVRVKTPVACVLRAGEAIFFSKDTPFSYEDDGVTTHYFVHFTGYAAEEVVGGVSLPIGKPFYVGNSAVVTEKFEHLFDVFLCRDCAFDTDAAGALLSLLAALGRAANPVKDVRACRVWRFEKSLRYIRQHMSETVRVKTLAELEYLSESRYRSVFTETFGQSPLEYQIGLRMKTACRLLLYSDLRVQQVAAAVGYADQRYFCRVFQKHVGKTPRAYRRG